MSGELELMAREGILENAAKKFEQWLEEKDHTTHALQ